MQLIMIKIIILILKIIMMLMLLQLIILNKIGWKDNQPCFYKIDLSNEIPKKYLNVSAKKLHIKKN